MPSEAEIEAAAMAAAKEWNWHAREGETQVARALVPAVEAALTAYREAGK
jgi:hypothetical protein